MEKGPGMSLGVKFAIESKALPEDGAGAEALGGQPRAHGCGGEQ